MIHNTEKSLSEHRSKLSAEAATEIEQDIQFLKEAMNGDDPDKLKEGVEKVKNAAMKIGQAMYANTGAGDQQQQEQPHEEQGQQQQQEGEGQGQEQDKNQNQNKQ